MVDFHYINFFMVRVTVIKHEQLFITARHEFLTGDKSRAVSALSSFRAFIHEVGDSGLVGLVSIVFTLWGTQNKRNLPH